MKKQTKSPVEKAARSKLPKGIVLKPPVTVESLMKNTEFDLEGAEEFVALIRAARREGSRPVNP
jgi:hypothetical protein